MRIHTELAEGRTVNRSLKDYTGQRFGRLTAVSFVERDPKWNDHKWEFRCDCGGVYVTGIKQARGGHTASCGCLFRDVMAERNTTHGLTKTNRSEYRSWKDMRARCLTPTDTDYRDYGGRGISVCSRWDDFAAFLEDMGPRPRGTTIDRIDVNGNYEPSNCRWASAHVQANNKRNNRLLEMNGVTKTLQEWCRQFGLEHSKVRYRLSRGWSLDDALKPGDYRKQRSPR